MDLPEHSVSQKEKKKTFYDEVEEMIISEIAQDWGSNSAEVIASPMMLKL